MDKVIKPAKKVIVDFGNGTTRKMFVYDDSIFMDTSILMRDLRTYLERVGVKFDHKKIKDFKEINSKYIINCTGLG